MDCRPPGSSVQGILQARILEPVPCPPPGDLPDSDQTHVSYGSWIVGGFFTTEQPGKPCVSTLHACMLSRFSHVRLCATPWTAAHQTPLSTGFSRQEYWSGLPFPSLGYSLWDCKEADTDEHARVRAHSHTHTHTCSASYCYKHCRNICSFNIYKLHELVHQLTIAVKQTSPRPLKLKFTLFFSASDSMI